MIFPPCFPPVVLWLSYWRRLAPLLFRLILAVGPAVLGVGSARPTLFSVVAAALVRFLSTFLLFGFFFFMDCFLWENTSY